MGDGQGHVRLVSRGDGPLPWSSERVVTMPGVVDQDVSTSEWFASEPESTLRLVNTFGHGPAVRTCPLRSFDRGAASAGGRPPPTAPAGGRRGHCLQAVDGTSNGPVFPVV